MVIRTVVAGEWPRKKMWIYYSQYINNATAPFTHTISDFKAGERPKSWDDVADSRSRVVSDVRDAYMSVQST